ncbi:MAG: SDR family NAD(P)-dependent oxidoreductase [Candidatus Acidiferrales bacterium]
MSGRRKVRIMTAGGDAGDRIRAALVTGGTGGIGRVIAAKLAADGFDVAVAYAGSVDLADATVKEIAGYGRRGAAFAADIADEEATSAVFDAIEDRFGHLDVVVHTAGINRPAALADLDLADFDEIHRVNVRGTFVVDQQAARRVRGGGAIVNVSSHVVRLAPPALSAYTASKAAVDAPPWYRDLTGTASWWKSGQRLRRVPHAAPRRRGSKTRGDSHGSAARTIQFISRPPHRRGSDAPQFLSTLTRSSPSPRTRSSTPCR